MLSNIFQIILYLYNKSIVKKNNMQAQNPCSIHETFQISKVCLSKDCQLQRIFCDVCSKDHATHHVINFHQFSKRYQQFQEINQTKNKQIRNLFLTVKNTFEICIIKAQERLLKQYALSSNISLPKLDSIESQQLWGIASQVCRNEKFEALATGATNITKFKAQENKLIESISIYLEQLNTNIMAAINKFLSQIQISKNNSNSLKLIPRNSHFNFNQNYTPKIFLISQNGQVITRNSTLNEGLSMHAIVDKPFTKQADTISFKILHQQKRFIYFGVCDADTFKDFQFKGPLYSKGNKMYSIRQSIKQGFNGVCLHNSLDQYSNKDKVPWDFAVDDIISIKYIHNRNCIIFTKNQKQTFQLPLDKAINKFYPFVGLKFNKDKVKIVTQNNLQIFEKKKGIQENFLNSIK